MTAEEFDKDRDSASFDDDLCLLCRARSNVRQSPGRFELNKSVGRSQEFNETTDNTSFDDLLDGRIALFGEKLAEFGGGLNLLVDLFREDSFHHFR